MGSVKLGSSYAKVYIDGFAKDVLGVETKLTTGTDMGRVLSNELSKEASPVLRGVGKVVKHFTH